MVLKKYLTGLFECLINHMLSYGFYGFSILLITVNCSYICI